jgi:hypothetical protein
MSMNFIQRVAFIHNGFSKICCVERSNVDAKFQKQFCMEISFPIDDGNEKEKNRKGSDVFIAMDNYFQLTFITG